MIVLETIAVAFSMFSAIPMPQFGWNERNMRYSLCAFPLIGAVIAACMWGWGKLCLLLALPEVLRGACACCRYSLQAVSTWTAIATHATHLRPTKASKIGKKY